MLPIVLASSSRYRRKLLERLQIPFTCASPEIDETPQEKESAEALVKRLAEEKARSLALQFPEHLIIGSDQAAVLGTEIIGKPGSHERAAKQLSAASGQRVSFLTGLALINTQSGQMQVDCIRFSVDFRELSSEQIERYLHREQPYDCAGSFKAEGLGISLFTRTEGEDSTSLIGLPLIRLVSMFNQEGIAIP